MVEEILGTPMPTPTPDELRERARAIARLESEDPQTLITVFSEDLSKTIVDVSEIVDAVAGALGVLPQAVRHFDLSDPTQEEEVRRVLREPQVDGLIIVHFPNLRNAGTDHVSNMVDLYINELRYPYEFSLRPNASQRRVLQVYDQSLPQALSDGHVYDALNKMNYVPHIDISDRIK